MAVLDIRQKAERIVELFRSRRPTEILPAELYPADLEEAYAIRRAFQEIEQATGRGAIAGYKIGLTTPVMQKLCGINEPCYGAIFAGGVHQSRAVLSSSEYCRLGVETEIALRLGDDLPAGSNPAQVAAAVESAMAAIELIEDLRYDYKRLALRLWWLVMYGMPGRSWERR
jgi:2-keto-4-pentenoate hydratase